MIIKERVPTLRTGIIKSYKGWRNICLNCLIKPCLEEAILFTKKNIPSLS